MVSMESTYSEEVPMGFQPNRYQQPQTRKLQTWKTLDSRNSFHPSYPK